MSILLTLIIIFGFWFLVATICGIIWYQFIQKNLNGEKNGKND